MTDGVLGRELAIAAHRVCQEVDPDQQGVPIAELEGELQRRSVAIAGPVQRKTLSTALNKHQDLFRRAGPATWAWTQPTFDPGVGLSGAALAEEAYLVMSRHPDGRTGMHYESIKRVLQDSGVKIRGGNPGDTLFTALQNASDWFEWTRSGTFRLK